MDIGMCEFYDGWERGLAGEVWVDVLHRKTPGIWAETVENTPYISVKKSAIFYVRRILVHAGNNDYFPGYISRLDTFRKVSSQDTTPAIPPYPQQYYRFTIIPLVIS